MIINKFKDAIKISGNSREKFTNNYYGYFNNTTEFYNYADNLFQKASNEGFKSTYDKAKRTGNIENYDFYGSSSFDVLENDLKQFINQDVLTEITAKSREIFSKIKLGGAFLPKKMIATDKPTGVFDFSLASKGLYKPQEYYCPSLNKLVDPDDVTKISVNPNKFALYIKQDDGTIKSYEVIQQQEGTQSLVDKKYTYEQALKAGNPPVIAQQVADKKHPNAKLIFRTTTKKIYLTRGGQDIGEDEGKEKFVDLFFPLGGSSLIKTDTFAWAIYPYLLLSMLLERAGFKVKILGYYAGWEGKRSFAFSYPVKDYEDKLNNDKVARNIADVRAFRWKVFKAMDSIWKVELGKYAYALGNVMTYATPRETAPNEYFMRYRNWLVEQTKSGSTNLNNINPDLMIYQAIDLDELQSAIKKDKKDNGNRKEDFLMDVFYDIIDRIDFSVSPAEIALKNIIQRAEKTKMPISDALAIATKAKNKSTSFVEGNPFGDSDKRLEKLKNLRKKLDKDLREAKSRIP